MSLLQQKALVTEDKTELYILFSNCLEVSTTPDLSCSPPANWLHHMVDAVESVSENLQNITFVGEVTQLQAHT